MKLQKTITALMISASIAASLAPAMPTYAATSTSTSTEAKIEHKDYLQELVDAGTISQSTYDKIKAYMTENAPEKKDKTQFTEEQLAEFKAKRDNTDGTRPERPAQSDETENTDKKVRQPKNTEDSTKPERPANADNNAAPREGIRHGGSLQMFDEMLKDNVITQKEYDSIKSSIPDRTEKRNGAKTASTTTA